MSSMLFSADSGLQQQVKLNHAVLISCNTSQILAQNSCNKMENKTSPRLIPTCESVHTVNKEVRDTLGSSYILIAKNNAI